MTNSNLPCWLTPKEKYIVNCLLSDGFYHFQNHQSETEEDDELCYMRKICDCKIGFAGCDNYISVIVNGCEVCLYLGDSPSEQEAEKAFGEVKQNIKKYFKAWESQGENSHKQLSFC